MAVRGAAPGGGLDRRSAFSGIPSVTRKPQVASNEAWRAGDGPNAIAPVVAGSSGGKHSNGCAEVRGMAARDFVAW